MSDQTNVINTFYVSREGGDVGAVACDADGKFVSAQICSSPFWARSDLGDGIHFHGWFYDQRYPEGYDIVWLDDVQPPNWDGQTAHTPETLKPYHMLQKKDD